MYLFESSFIYILYMALNAGYCHKASLQWTRHRCISVMSQRRQLARNKLPETIREETLRGNSLEREHILFWVTLHSAIMHHYSFTSVFYKVKHYWMCERIWSMGSRVFLFQPCSGRFMLQKESGSGSTLQVSRAEGGRVRISIAFNYLGHSIWHHATTPSVQAPAYLNP